LIFFQGGKPPDPQLGGHSPSPDPPSQYLSPTFNLTPTPLIPGPPFLQSGVPRPQRAHFPWKDSSIHGNATSESGFGQDNCPTRNTGAAAK